MMKATVFCAFLMFFGFSYAQITQGKISYDVEIASDNPQMAAALGESSSLLEIYFVEGKSRSNLFIGEMSTNTTVSVAGNDTALVLLDNMYMGKIALKSTKNDMDEEMRKSTEVTDITFVEEETKEIIGYTCKKAIVTIGGENKFEIWYTEEIVPTHRADQYLFEEIAGVPLEMSSSYFNMGLKMTAYEVKDKIGKKQMQTLFDLNVPKGYTLKTMEELQQFGKRE